MTWIHRLFLTIYVLPLSRLILLIGIASILFLYLRNVWETTRIWNGLLILALLLWSAIVLYSTIGERSPGSVEQPAFTPFHSYKELMKGGNPEILRSNFMNLVLFYPAGLIFTSLLPKKLPGWSRSLLALVLFTLFSAGIEYIQHIYALGVTEIDDVIHNATGALLGSLCALIRPKPAKVRS